MTTKINISLPDETLKAIEKTAKERGVTRSALIRKAAIAYIEELKREEAQKKLERQRYDAAEAQDRIREALGVYDSGRELRKWRDKRR